MIEFTVASVRRVGRIFPALLLAGALLLSAGSLLAQVASPAGEADRDASVTESGPSTPDTATGGATDTAPDEACCGAVYYGRKESGRLRWTVGFGRGEVKPGVVSEASPAWFLNSAIRSSIDSTYQPVLPLSPGGVAKYWSLQSGLEYAYVDRLFVTANWYRIDQGLGSQNSTTVTFFHPAQESGGFRWSYFEGLRLTRYVEDQRTLEAKYLYPVLLQGFKAGAFVAREWYREENDISYGSFQATSASSAIQPNTTAWSAAGIVPGVYRMRGWTFGAAFRYQLFDWLGFYYKLGSVRRSGSYDQGGLQVLSVSQAASGSGSSAVAASQAAHLLLPFAAAQATDSGLRHNLEAVFRIYCRYSITIGVLREDLSRSYGTYLGYTFGTINNLYSQKTPTGLGIGETSAAHELSKREIYLKFGTDFFF